MKFKILSVVLIAMAVTACNKHNHENEQEEGHKQNTEILQVNNYETGHEHGQSESTEHVGREKIQYTTYTGSYELFAEADIFVIGEQSNILSHFSKLPSFKPLETGPVTIILSINSQEIKQTLDRPARKGIYSFEITPVTSGTGTLRFQIDTAIITVNGVRVYEGPNEVNEHAPGEELSMVNKVVFTKEQSWKIDFKTEVVKKQAFGQVIKTVAKTGPGSGNEKVIAAKTGGIILFSNNNLLEGKEVSAGQTLFSISAGGMSDNNISVKIVEAKNNFGKAEADYQRKKELAADKIISGKELLDAKTTYDNAKVVYENFINNFNEGGQSITSPVKGFLKQIFVTNGQYVEAGQPLVTVSQNHSLVLTAFVQQQYSSILPDIHSANIKTLNEDQPYTFEELNGKVLSYGKSVNDDSYLIPLYLQIDNKAGFIQGNLVEIYLKTITDSQAVTIPNSALMEEQGNYFVFVQETPELFEKRQVKTGVTDGFHREIISGLTPGERIVSKGAMLIKLAQASGALDAHSGHVH